MTSIANVPDELLIQMCENWETPELLNMSEAYSRVYRVCRKEIIDRQTDFIIKKLEKQSVSFKKIDSNIEIKVIILLPMVLDQELSTMIIQMITPSDDTIPWMLPGIVYQEEEKTGSKVRTTFIDIDLKSKLREIVREILLQEYILEED